MATPPLSPRCSTVCSITRTCSSAGRAAGVPRSRQPCAHMTLLWPGLRCPIMAGFDPSAEGTPSRPERPLSPIHMCRKRSFGTYGRGYRPASAAVCRIPCLILCLADVERVCQCRAPNAPRGLHGRVASVIASRFSSSRTASGNSRQTTLGGWVIASIYERARSISVHCRGRKRAHRAYGVDRLILLRHGRSRQDNLFDMGSSALKIAALNAFEQPQAEVRPVTDCNGTPNRVRKFQPNGESASYCYTRMS